MDNKSGKKSVKYSVAFDGTLPCASSVFTEARYASEDMALPEVIMSHVKKESDHKNIYVIDRGFQSTRTMKTFTKESITFICRAKENRKYVDQRPGPLFEKQECLAESGLWKRQRDPVCIPAPVPGTDARYVQAGVQFYLCRGYEIA